MPKGVMLSHDNYTWVYKSFNVKKPESLRSDEQFRAVSYLPLSHVAAQLQDITGAMMDAMHIYFAEPTALQGTLIQTLIEVRPYNFVLIQNNIFLSSKSLVEDSREDERHGKPGRCLKIEDCRMGQIHRS